MWVKRERREQELGREDENLYTGHRWGGGGGGGQRVGVAIRGTGGWE